MCVFFPDSPSLRSGGSTSYVVTEFRQGRFEVAEGNRGPATEGTPTETGGECLQCEVTVAAGIQGVKDVLQLLGRQWQLSVEPLPGMESTIMSSTKHGGNEKETKNR